MSCRRSSSAIRDTQLLELLQPDMLGILRGKRVVRDEFDKPFGKASTSAAPRCFSMPWARPSTASTNGSRDGDPDAISTAVPGSLAPVPWAQVPTAQVLLSMATATGSRFSPSRVKC